MLLFLFNFPQRVVGMLAFHRANILLGVMVFFGLMASIAKRLAGLHTAIVRVYLEDILENMVAFFVGHEFVVSYARQCLVNAI